MHMWTKLYSALLIIRTKKNVKLEEGLDGARRESWKEAVVDGYDQIQ